jgi:hypothetical protein
MRLSVEPVFSAYTKPFVWNSVTEIMEAEVHRNGEEQSRGHRPDPRTGKLGRQVSQLNLEGIRRGFHQELLSTTGKDVQGNGNDVWVWLSNESF